MFEKITLNHVLINNIVCFFVGDDILIYQDKENPDRTFIIEITEDGKYLVMFTIKDSARVRGILFVINIIFTFCSRKISYGLPTSTRTTLARTSNG